MADPQQPSPIQVVLNAGAFVVDWNRPGGGDNKDFFAGRDQEFAKHKKEVLGQVKSSREALTSPGQPGIGFLKVSMRTAALAKTHKPIKSIFRPDRAPVVGGAGVGELIVQVTNEALGQIEKTIQDAEPETRYKTKKAKPGKEPKTVPNPSRSRSELGAIGKVTLWDANDRRKFSVDEAVKWLQDPRTGGFYLVELFSPPPALADWDLYEAAPRSLYQELRDTLVGLGSGVRAARLPLMSGDQALFAVWLVEQKAPAQLFFDVVRDLGQVAPDVSIDLNPKRHKALLEKLDRLTLVKRVYLPPIIERHQAAPGPSAAGIAWKPEKRQSTQTYPKVAVIDGGIADCLSEWVVDKWDTIATVDESLQHGTFIGGLLVGGQAHNAENVVLEPDGCELVDIKLLPSESDPTAFGRYYGTSGAIGFFQELDAAVATLRQRSDVRIFNLSANFQSMADPQRYSPLTAELDAIADAHDALFVISAGNAEGADCRQEWPADPLAAMATLAAATQDRVCSPAESIRNMSVGALNPPHLAHVVGHAPAAYSRRGPALSAGLKPDVAHVGGCNTPSAGDHGLWSVHPNGHLYSSAGTSYATPLVAKTLASLDHQIEGHVSRETLMGLLLHHSHLPGPLSNPAFGRVARHLVGFGMPQAAGQILAGQQSQITMVFSARLMRKRHLEFAFSWPACLSTDEGKCRGFAQLTLVSTPPLDPRAGTEFVRVDIQPHLNQKCPNGGHLSAGWLPSQKGAEYKREARLIAELMKWSPVKLFQWKSDAGQGTSTDWTLKVDHLGRDEESIPEDGVPFTLLLTIGDLEGSQPVFQEMRQSLQTQGLKLEQIQTATRISPRV